MSEHTNVPPGERPQSPAAAISNQMVHLFSKYFGRGPTRARTTLNTNVALITMADTLTKAEQNLIAAGEAEAVRSLRRTLQGSMRAEAVARIEEILGRTVIGYMADVDTDANMGVVAFVFEPAAESGIVEVAESDS
jgi:uncharacterized protein YbcI